MWISAAGEDNFGLIDEDISDFDSDFEESSWVISEVNQEFLESLFFEFSDGILEVLCSFFAEVQDTDIGNSFFNKVISECRGFNNRASNGQGDEIERAFSEDFNRDFTSWQTFEFSDNIIESHSTGQDAFDIDNFIAGLDTTLEGGCSFDGQYDCRDFILRFDIYTESAEGIIEGFAKFFDVTGFQEIRMFIIEGFKHTLDSAIGEFFIRDFIWIDVIFLDLENSVMEELEVNNIGVLLVIRSF